MEWARLAGRVGSSRANVPDVFTSLRDGWRLFAITDRGEGSTTTIHKNSENQRLYYRGDMVRFVTRLARRGK
jgi:hypothetical protein